MVVKWVAMKPLCLAKSNSAFQLYRFEDSFPTHISLTQIGSNPPAVHTPISIVLYYSTFVHDVDLSRVIKTISCCRQHVADEPEW